MEAFLGTIMAVSFDYAPRGWMKCEGQSLAISQNSTLFSLLGVRYGGDGMSTFNLPDLRTRTPIGVGQGQNLRVELGQPIGSPKNTTVATGSASVTLDAAHLPKHSHTVTVPGDQFTAVSTVHVASTGPGVSTPAAGCALGASGGGTGGANIYVSGKTLDVSLDGYSVATTISGNAVLTTGETGVTPTPVTVPISIPLSIDLMQPSLGLNYIICVSGIYPPRD